MSGHKISFTQVPVAPENLKERFKLLIICFKIQNKF